MGSHCAPCLSTNPLSSSVPVSVFPPAWWEGGGPDLCEKMSYGAITGSGGLGSRGPFGGPSRQGYQPLGNDSGGQCVWRRWGDGSGRSPPCCVLCCVGGHRRALSLRTRADTGPGGGGAGGLSQSFPPGFALCVCPSPAPAGLPALRALFHEHVVRFILPLAGFAFQSATCVAPRRSRSRDRIVPSVSLLCVCRGI